ncbi:hypothetical protein J3A65_001877 [Rhizobium sp. PvP014]|nr:hypothetical protein [Rhizobium sp. PvP014]MBP2528509.1 hypothetical protein [Rhizobium sp. PvP099]
MDVCPTRTKTRKPVVMTVASNDQTIAQVTVR